MTTAHRPTFDPARGKDALRGPAYHQRLLPAHTTLKYRKRGQGGAADDGEGAVDLRAELLAAEAAHFAKLNGGSSASAAASSSRRGPIPGSKPDGGDGDDGSGSDEAAAQTKRRIADDDEDPEAKRRRILEESRDLDRDDSDDGSDEDDSDDVSDDDSDDSDDEDALLQRELEKIKREKAEKREREERERAAAEAEERERDIARGNPLLNKPDFNIKRRWDDDVVFKNQARGTEEKGKKKEFINDLLRSDFHKRFMSRYVR
ncbi:hypothetical protein MAPG_08341 [Magnaporthiopsis poae ATCC 64411]|uniref:Pre-mRNA-splicing factor cwc15 n=1 Tax=Magnaporthiopsis poae (strain ATCC 64411 / 73-15) TaxID=644358 RepID=A0A0C4E740_MAGP6|nr:hypothetical protein MAPG_08341 [Magnaporthiopsis poae ATCC 64411]